MNPKDLQRFWSKVEKSGSCWIWKAGRFTTGYGLFRLNKKNTYAHRIVYELIKGEIPKGLTLDHLCRNRFCVNPEHLEIVTVKENVLRGIGITAVNHKKTRCPQNHEYNQENTYISNNKRYCRTCKRERDSQRYYEQKTSATGEYER